MKLNDEEKQRQDRIQDGIRNTISLFDQKKPAKSHEIIENSKSKKQHSCYMMNDLANRMEDIIKEHDKAFGEVFQHHRADPVAAYAKRLGTYFNEICHITQVLIQKTTPRE